MRTARPAACRRRPPRRQSCEWGTLRGKRPGRGRWVAGVIGGPRPGLESNCSKTAGSGATRARARSGHRTLVQSPERGRAAADDAGVSSPPFTFRLERIRSLRERAEDRAKEEYAASLAHRLEGVAMLRAAAEHRDQARAATRPTADAALTGTDFLASQAWLERLERSPPAARPGLDRPGPQGGPRPRPP